MGKPLPMVDWQNFVCYLIDNCEGETITEEGLHRIASEFVKNPRYFRDPVYPMAPSELQQAAHEVLHVLGAHPPGSQQITAALARLGAAARTPPDGVGGRDD